MLFHSAADPAIGCLIEFVFLEEKLVMHRLNVSKHKNLPKGAQSKYARVIRRIFSLRGVIFAKGFDNGFCLL